VEITQQLDHVGDLVLRRQDRGSEVVGPGNLSEARAGHQHDARVVQKLHAIEGIALDSARLGSSDGLGCKIIGSRKGVVMTKRSK